MVPLLVLHLLGGYGGVLPSPAPAPQDQGAVCVVANLPGDPPDADVDLVRRIFELRQSRWPDGTRAHPVNLPAASPVRGEFSQAVFGQSVQEMAPYWNERYFHGTRPPPSLASEQAVLLYVARTKGGVGYVKADSANALPAGVKKVLCVGAAGG